MKDMEFSRRGLLATGVGSLVATLPIADANAAPADHSAAPKAQSAASETADEAASYIPGIIEFEIWSA